MKEHAGTVSNARFMVRPISSWNTITSSSSLDRAWKKSVTLFFHARSKDELLVMVFQEDMGRTINRAFETVPACSFINQAMYVFDAMMKQDRRDLELARVFVKELGFVKGDHHDIDAVTESF